MSNRAAYALAFACWGAAIGVVIYRVAILGLAGMGDGYGFLGAAVGLAFLGRMAVRNQDRPSIPPLLIAGVAGLGLALAATYVIVPPLGSSRLSTHQFPGFTVDLPSGEIRSEDNSYQSGKLALAINDAPMVALVQWEPGADFSDDELTMIATGVGAAAGGIKPGAVTTVEGVPTVEVSTDKGLFEVSMKKCGARHVAIATGGGDGIAKLHRRIVASFQCHPDAAQETATASVDFPLALDVPGWQQVVHDNQQIQLAKGHALLVLERTTANSDPQSLSVLAPMLKSQGLDVTVGAVVGDRAPMTMKDGDKTLTGFALLKSCSTASGLVFALASDDQSMPMLQQIADSARCLKPGEPAQKFEAATP